MSCFFPSGVSAMINESPLVPAGLTDSGALKLFLPRSARRKIRSGLSNGSVVAAIRPAACHPVYHRRVMRLRGLALALESVCGGFDGLRSQGDKGVPGTDQSDEAAEETGAGRWAGWPLNRVLVIAGFVATVLAGVILGSGDPS